jgi:hypothetical protein
MRQLLPANGTYAKNFPQGLKPGRFSGCLRHDISSALTLRAFLWVFRGKVGIGVCDWMA